MSISNHLRSFLSHLEMRGSGSFPTYVWILVTNIILGIGVVAYKTLLTLVFGMMLIKSVLDTLKAYWVLFIVDCLCASSYSLVAENVS